MPHKRNIFQANLILARRNIRSYINSHDKIISNLLAIFIGVGVAYAAIAFRGLIFLTQEVALENAEENILDHIATLDWWKILLSTIAGGLIISAIYRFLMRGERPLGIAEVMEANALHHTKIPVRQGIFSAVASALALGTGSAAGREGPVVHLGATLASWISDRLHLSQSISRTLLGCGVAAAVSASFNAPIAGVFFALEVILGHYALHAFAPIVIASVSAAIVSRIHLGDFPAFIIPQYHITSFWEFPAFLLLGVVSAMAAIIFIKSIFFTEDVAAKIPLPEWLRPPVGGLMVGLLAIFCPYILGVGYGTTDGALKELLPLGLLFVLIVAKTAATAISLAFRYGAGVFSPSLFLGAVVGGAFGGLATLAFPDFSSGQGLYAIVGMGAVASAVLGAPISTILIIFELTGDYQITMALMAAVVVANLITTHYLKASSFFHMQLARRGLDLEGGRARHLMRASRVRDFMCDDYATLDPNTPLEEVRELILNQPYNNLFVLDDQHAVSGVITFMELRKVHMENTEAPQTATDICRNVAHLLKPDDHLEYAFDLFDRSGEEKIPVISDAKIIGVLYHRDVLSAYNKALLDS